MSVHDFLIDLTAFFASKLRNLDLVNSLYILMKVSTPILESLDDK